MECQARRPQAQVFVDEVPEEPPVLPEEDDLPVSLLFDAESPDLLVDSDFAFFGSEALRESVR